MTWVLAHVGRTIRIAETLRARGHEVVFAGEDANHPLSYLRFAADAGFRIVHVKEPQWHWAWKRFHDHGGWIAIWDFFNCYRWAPLDEILEDMIRVVEAEQPDLLLGDSSMGVSTVSRITGVRAAGILNAYNLRFFEPQSLYRGIIRACDRIKWAPVRKRVYQHHNTIPGDAIEMLKQMLLLSPDLAVFHDPRSLYPNWQPIGPLIFEPNVPLPDWYDDLTDGRRNVYLTMGSTGLLEPLLLRTYAVLARAPYRFLVTTGAQVSQNAIDAAPDNFRFARYAPGSKLLERCSALVFHGGNGTMYQALAAGVPMLALPTHLEQDASVAPGLEEGFARRANCRRISGAELVKEIDLIIDDPSYRLNALRFRQAVRTARAEETAADLLISLVSTHKHELCLANAIS